MPNTTPPSSSADRFPEPRHGKVDGNVAGLRCSATKPGDLEAGPSPSLGPRDSDTHSACLKKPWQARVSRAVCRLGVLWEQDLS